MLRTWNENHGTAVKHDCRATIADESPGSELDEVATSQIVARSGNAEESLEDIQVWDIQPWVLSFVSCCFEGTIFLLMFFWPGSLQEAHERENPDEEDEAANAVPYGVTFACFMGTMVLGALFFNALARHRHHHHRVRAYAHVDLDLSSHLKSENGIKSEAVSCCWKCRIAAVLTPTRLLAAALFLAAASFLAAAFARAELSLFAAYLILEACNGVYVPSIAYHRSAIVSDEDRASIYGIMNIPLFIFVVVALLTTALCPTSDRRGGSPLYPFYPFYPFLDSAH